MDDSNGQGRDPMLDVFIYEENQLIDQLEEIMLETEKDGGLTDENINEIFRIMHTIKGSSAMMSFNNISKLAHSVEDLFYYIRENKPEGLDISAICDLVLPASDFIKQEVAKIDGGGSSDGDEAQLEGSIRSYLESISGSRARDTGAAKTAAVKKTAGKEPAAKENVPDMQPQKPEEAEQPAEPQPAEPQLAEPQAKDIRYACELHFEDGGQMENLRAFTIVRNLSELARDIQTDPPDLINSSADNILENGFRIWFTTGKEEKQIRNLFEEALFLKSYDLRRTENAPAAPASQPEPAQAPSSPAEAPASPADGKADARPAEKPAPREMEPAAQRFDASREAQKNTKSSLISVNINKLDTLMNLVGEIVISESMVTKNPDLEGLQLESFSKAARQLRKLTDELQDIVMSIRMIQIAGTFQKMQRIVRDMSRKLNKDVEFVTVGEETEVDKNIIDHLSDPLMHLIRNAMDHGVESEEERIRAGKPKKARITLMAQDTGGDVQVSVSDDGKGLNKAKIIEKARAAGLLKKSPDEMTDKEIYSLIMLPGFSTNDVVTEYSGRGVGMDVVRQNIEEVGGSVSIKSVEGEGTTITVSIPLTLAIADAMELSVGSSVFTLPITSIRESFRPKDNEIIYDNMGHEMIMIRGNVYPILRLHQIFGIESAVTKISEGILIMVEGDNKSICVFADQLLGEQQVVVKPLPPFLIHYKVKEQGIEGCTIRGNGSISLILNARGLISNII